VHTCHMAPTPGQASHTIGLTSPTGGARTLVLVGSTSPTPGVTDFTDCD
jgi:hypothetical protein